MKLPVLATCAFLTAFALPAAAEPMSTRTALFDGGSGNHRTLLYTGEGSDFQTVGKKKHRHRSHRHRHSSHHHSRYQHRYHNHHHYCRPNYYHHRPYYYSSPYRYYPRGNSFGFYFRF